MGIAYAELPDYNEGVTEVLEAAYSYMTERKAPYVLLVRKANFEQYRMKKSFIDSTKMLDMPLREEALNLVCDAFPDVPVVSTTGFASRELFELRKMRGESHRTDFLTVGSMGHCSSIAAGVALGRPAGQTLCVDGDGGCLMHMGAMSTLGQMGRQGHLKNFKHVLMNNNVHDSVGGQPSAGSTTDFVSLAQSCGYSHSELAIGMDDAVEKLKRLSEFSNGPAFLEIKLKPGTRSDLGRPTSSPLDNKNAFMDFLQER
jgi:phosphonopyruvate decarboxylase